MNSRDDRGASAVIGTVIIFAFAVISFSVYQGIVIPEENRATEFQHNLDAQKSMQDIRNAIRQTGMTGAEESVTITLGATYPERAIGINPGASAGSFSTRSVGSMSIENITARDNETQDYFGPSQPTLGPFQTKTIGYDPVYTRYTEAPETVYENTLAFNRFPNGENLSLTDQTLVEDRKINILILNGSVSEAHQESVTVDTEALSTVTRAVTVTNETGPINITIATQLTAADWDDLLENEQNVENVKATGPNQVSIILKKGVTYELRMAKVGVGTDTTSEQRHYITDSSGDDETIPEAGQQKLVVEVRDRFNNPVSGVTVNATLTQAAGATDTVTPDQAPTDAEGRATFTYHAPEQASESLEATVDVTYNSTAVANETVTFDLTVLGQATNLIQLEDSFPTDASSPHRNVTLQLNNTAAKDLNITGIALNYATTTNQNGEVEDGPNKVVKLTVVDGPSESRVIDAVEGQSPVFLSNPLMLPGDNTVSDLILQFDQDFELDNPQESIAVSVRVFFEGGLKVSWSVYLFG